MQRLSSQIVFAGLAFLSLGGPTLAESADCDRFLDVSLQRDLALAAVTAERVHFVKSGSGNRSCPSTSAACRDKAYLVKGDLVILTKEANGFVCATYPSRTGHEWSGWIPSGSVKRRPSSPSGTVRDWQGVWKGQPEREQLITIKRGRSPEALLIEGYSTVGADDPERVKRGDINVGGFKAELRPRGPTLAFTSDADGKTLPYEEGGDYACRVQMRLLGPYLLVDASPYCGGSGVVLRGAYRKG